MGQEVKGEFELDPKISRSSDASTSNSDKGNSNSNSNEHMQGNIDIVGVTDSEGRLQVALPAGKMLGHLPPDLDDDDEMNESKG